MSSIIRWVVAVVVAVSISFGAFALGQQAERASQPIEAPAVTVYQAVQDITLGYSFDELLEAQAVRAISVPDFAVPEGSITPDNMPEAGTILSLNLRAGQLLSELQFREFDELIQSSGVNPEAFQVTLALSDEQSVAGLVRAGSLVTVYGTYQVPTETDPISVTEIVIPEAPVSLVGLATDAEDERGISYITLTLNAEQSQRLVHYMKSAELHLSLFGAQADASNLGPIVGLGDATSEPTSGAGATE